MSSAEASARADDGTSVPLLTSVLLAQAQHPPLTPFRVVTDDGTRIVVDRLLRVLPGRRLVGEARWQGLRVLAKLFVAGGSERHWQRELRGITLLAKAGLPTPPLHVAGRLQSAGHFLLTEFLDPANTLNDALLAVGAAPLAAQETTATEPQTAERDVFARRLALLQPAFALTGRLHAAGLLQHDLHLGNFLCHAGQLYLIDGDGVRPAGEGAGGRAQRQENLALLLAQLPADWLGDEDAVVPDGARVLLAAYDAAAPAAVPFDTAQLCRAVDGARQRRLAQFLGKTLRDCSQFAVQHSFTHFVSVVREEREALAELLCRPDAALAAGRLLKDGNTCTVARVGVAGRALLLKRYNLKGFGHALSRFWRPSRAWHSWLAGHRLAFLGIATPKPLALCEERLGPLRRRAFLLTEFCVGHDLALQLQDEREPSPSEAAALLALFGALYRQRISHGDMKASNFIWHDGRVSLIDLDSLIQHRDGESFQRAWARDRARFLRNWTAASPLYRWLDTNLPRGKCTVA